MRALLLCVCFVVVATVARALLGAALGALTAQSQKRFSNLLVQLKQTKEQIEKFSADIARVEAGLEDHRLAFSTLTGALGQTCATQGLKSDLATQEREATAALSDSVAAAKRSADVRLQAVLQRQTWELDCLQSARHDLNRAATQLAADVDELRGRIDLGRTLMDNDDAFLRDFLLSRVGAAGYVYAGDFVATKRSMPAIGGHIALPRWRRALQPLAPVTAELLQALPEQDPIRALLESARTTHSSDFSGRAPNSTHVALGQIAYAQNRSPQDARDAERDASNEVGVNALPGGDDQARGGRGYRRAISADAAAPTSLWHSDGGTTAGGAATAQFSTCAVVGSSGVLLARQAGAEIDAHEVVIRFNRAPAVGYEEYVGSRTTLRLVNRQHFGFRERASEIVLQQATTPEIVQQFVKLKEELPGTKTFMVSPAFHRFVVSDNVKPATNGFYGLVLGMQVCKRVRMYGMFRNPSRGVPYHYFNAEEPVVAQHTRDVEEMDLILAMVAASRGRLSFARVCSESTPDCLPGRP